MRECQETSTQGGRSAELSHTLSLNELRLSCLRREKLSSQLIIILESISDRGDDFGGIDGVVIAAELVKWGIAMSISYYLSQVRFGRPLTAYIALLWRGIVIVVVLVICPRVLISYDTSSWH